MKTTSLNSRFHSFLSKLPSAEVIDELLLPPEFDKSKRADFLVENRGAIIEIKSLETDPEHKVLTELEKQAKRTEYPVFYGKMELTKVLRHLPDGKRIQKQLFQKISRSIEQSFREAEKQIESTKSILGCPAAYGILVLLNESVSVLSPQLISSRASQLLTKQDSDGRLHYTNVSSVWFITENYSLKNEEGAKLLPSVVIDGPSGVDRPELSRIFTLLQNGWAAFNGVPLVNVDRKRVSDSDFITIASLEKEDARFKPRHEIWRLQYRRKPYLRSLSDEDVLRHGAKLVKFITLHFLIGGMKLQPSQVEQFMEGFTHFLEEANHRGLDMKKMAKFQEG